MALFTVVVLWVYGVPPVTTLIFGAYAVGGIVLPGTLVWRAAHRRPRSFVADVAAGTAVGYAGEVGCYIAGSALGVPLLVLVWPLGVLAAFALVPNLRRYWRGAGADADRTPTWWAWGMAIVMAVMLLWACVAFFQSHGVVWPGTAGPDADSLFHLALIGEAKHHFPLVYPWLSNEPLIYHWFVYTEMAATSWVTGIEPQLLLLRLSALPMMAAATVLFAVMARRLTGRWWAGLAAVALTYFVLAPNPYKWGVTGSFSYFSFSPFEDGSMFRILMWTSPTATLGVVLFAATILLLLDLLKSTERVRFGQWALLTLLIAGVMGAKASFLPVLLCGLLLAVAVELVLRRRWLVPALIALGITVAALAFAQLVLFGGVSSGLEIHPLESMARGNANMTTGFAPVGGPVWRFAWMTLLTLACAVAVWAGIGFLFLRSRWRKLEPSIVLLLGIGIAGLAAFLVSSEDGGAEGWFFFSVRPYLSIAAVVGLATVVRLTSMTRRVGLSIAGGIALGGLIAVLVTRLTSARRPSIDREGAGVLAITLAWPYAVVFGVVLIFIVLLVRYRDRLEWTRGLVPVLAICLIAGTGFAGSARLVKYRIAVAQRDGWQNVNTTWVVAPGTTEAGRWLRDNSRPDDLVATNAHCIRVFPDVCDKRHFSVTGYTERRVLIEGWAFTAQSHLYAVETGASPSYEVDYWDPARLADNEAVFNAPSAENVGRLRDHYGVRWLFVDRSAGASLDPHSVGPSVAALQPFATLRFQSGDCEVYEINP